MLHIEYAALADYATDRGGAVTACGLGINRLTVRQVPTTHPQIFLVAQLREDLGETAFRKVKVTLSDPGGNHLSELNGNLQFAAIDSKERVARIVLGFYSVQFPRYGDYLFQVDVDTQPVIALKFSVHPGS